MEPIVWSENFSVGVQLFDEQHKRLIMMLNKMIKHPTVPTRSETVSEILTDMTLYSLEHFKAEEDLMIKHGYPQFEQHKSQHQSFRIKVTELCMATTHDIEAVPQVLLEYLGQWWVQHILHEDMDYKQFFEEKER
jgi:hemerythrin-like metal-binding protein